MYDFDYIIKSFKNSKSFKIYIKDNQVILSKPHYASNKDALKFLEKNNEWVLENLKKTTPPITLESYLKEYPHLYVDNQLCEVYLQNKATNAFFVEDYPSKKIVFAYNEETKSDSLKQIFLAYSKSKLTHLAKKQALELNIQLNKITIRNQSTRWGSMSSQRNLSLNWRIILLDKHLQNYIILHELAHINFMNHSSAFWLYLSRICPNAKKLDRQLANIKMLNIK